MKKRTRFVLYILLSGFFVFLDQLCKYVARTHPNSTWYILPPWLGWEYYENPGVAFNLPIPTVLVLTLTPIILIALIFFLRRKHHLPVSMILGSIFIIGGALSNFIDRIFFNVTIDYIRVLTAIINIADMMIIGGALLLLKKEKQI